MNQLKALVFEESESLRGSEVRSLENFGLSVESFGDPDQALAHMKEMGDSYFDLILLDYLKDRVPVGDRVAINLLNTFPNYGADVYVVTGVLNKRNLLMRMDDMGVVVLSKPFSRDDLGEVVAKLYWRKLN